MKLVSLKQIKEESKKEKLSKTPVLYLIIGELHHKAYVSCYMSLPCPLDLSSVQGSGR